MTWDQVDTRLPYPSGKSGSIHYCQGDRTRISQVAPTCEKLVLGHGGRLDPKTGVAVYGQKLQIAAEILAYAIQAKEIGVFKPYREKDELTYAIGTDEHSGRTRGLGRNTSWEHGFPNDKETYRSRQRRKEEEAARNRMLEPVVLQEEEKAKALEERMQV